MTFNPMDLTGKHILITGASSGIGRSACIQASKLGAKVSLVARSEEKLKETISLMEGSGHEYFVFDLNNIEGIEGLIKIIFEKNGAFDGLVHCAGIAQNRPVKLNKPDFMLEIMRISYFAFAELMRSASFKNRSNENASYLGVSSVASIKGNKTQGGYAGAKGAMNALVHPYAKELAAKKIRVNVIAFGMIDTNMYKDFLSSGCNNDELFSEQYLGIIPVEYAGNAICFLLSDSARFITGSVFLYDAGVLS